MSLKATDVHTCGVGNSTKYRRAALALIGGNGVNAAVKMRQGKWVLWYLIMHENISCLCRPPFRDISEREAERQHGRPALKCWFNCGGGSPGKQLMTATAGKPQWQHAIREIKSTTIVITLGEMGKQRASVKQLTCGWRPDRGGGDPDPSGREWNPCQSRSFCLQAETQQAAVSVRPSVHWFISSNKNKKRRKKHEIKPRLDRQRSLVNGGGSKMKPWWRWSARRSRLYLFQQFQMH